MFKKEVCLKYRRESKQRLKFKEDYRATRDYIIRACECTWCDWVGGSRLFFEVVEEKLGGGSRLPF